VRASRAGASRGRRSYEFGSQCLALRHWPRCLIYCLEVSVGNRSRLRAILAALLLSTAAATLLAHHSVAEYDMQNLVTIKGIVTKVEWTNPHVFVYLNVKDEKGDVHEWSMEVDSVLLMRRYGWTRNMVKPGDEISCTGGPAKTGAKIIRGTMVQLADGTKMRVWSRV
jgi:hypothetical protein